MHIVPLLKPLHLVFPIVSLSWMVYDDIMLQYNSLTDSLNASGDVHFTGSLLLDLADDTVLASPKSETF